MGLEKTLKELASALRELCDRTAELGLTLHEDQPKKNGSAIVDKFEYAVMDVEGWVREALVFADVAEQAAGHPANLDRVRHELGQCQDRVRRTDQAFSASLLSWDLMKELMGFARERKGEWRSWAASVQEGIGQCRQPLEDSRNRLADAWQEIAERVGTTSISVTATSIGQKVVSEPKERGEVLQ